MIGNSENRNLRGNFFYLKILLLLTKNRSTWACTANFIFIFQTNRDLVYLISLYMMLDQNWEKVIFLLSSVANLCKKNSWWIFFSQMYTTIISHILSMIVQYSHSLWLSKSQGKIKSGIFNYPHQLLICLGGQQICILSLKFKLINYQ